MSFSELPEYAVRNRATWTKSNYTHEHGVRAYETLRRPQRGLIWKARKR